MSEECSHNCSSCGSDCAERAVPQNTRNDNNKNVKKVIAVVSGKGGVGKSLVTSLLAVKSRREGLKTAVLDADITGHLFLSLSDFQERRHVMRQEL